MAVAILISEVVRSRPDMFPEMARMAAVWETELNGYGPGCIDMHLAEISSSAVTREEFLRLAAIVEDKIVVLGEKIPASLLNDHLPRTIVTFFDFPTADIIRTLAEMKRLVTQ
jgi:hypothetical protein